MESLKKDILSKLEARLEGASTQVEVQRAMAEFNRDVHEQVWGTPSPNFTTEDVRIRIAEMLSEERKIAEALPDQIANIWLKEAELSFSD
jgi:hypothetical protein